MLQHDRRALLDGFERRLLAQLQMRDPVARDQNEVGIRLVARHLFEQIVDHGRHRVAQRPDERTRR